MPLVALIVGCTMVLRNWGRDAEFRRAIVEILSITRAHVVPVVIAGTTLMAAGILAIVAMHMITE
jgi:hypothetical protein